MAGFLFVQVLQLPNSSVCKNSIEVDGNKKKENIEKTMGHVALNFSERPEGSQKTLEKQRTHNRSKHLWTAGTHTRWWTN